MLVQMSDKTEMRNTVRATNGNRGNGSNWIRRERRLAIYLRDGMACVYCGASLEDEGTVLSLDHITPVSHGGRNCSGNLVTACTRCNNNRGSRDVASFAAVVAQYIDRGVTAEEIVAHVADCAARTLDRRGAARIIARRCSWQLALAAAQGGRLC